MSKQCPGGGGRCPLGFTDQYWCGEPSGGCIFKINQRKHTIPMFALNQFLMGGEGGEVVSQVAGNPDHGLGAPCRMRLGHLGGGRGLTEPAAWGP